MNKLIELYNEMRNELNTMIFLTTIKERDEKEQSMAWRGCIAGERAMLRMVARKAIVADPHRVSNESIARDLEALKDGIAWEHDRTYEAWLDGAIQRLREEN